MLRLPVVRAGFKRNCPLDRRPDDRDTAVARRVAIAIAGRPGGAGLRNGPGRAVFLPHTPRQEQGIGLGRRAHAGHVGVGDAEQGLARCLRIDDRAADEPGGRTRQRQQRRGDQSAGRGFRHSDGLAAPFESRRDGFGQGQQGIHGMSREKRGGNVLLQWLPGKRAPERTPAAPFGDAGVSCLAKTRPTAA